MNQRNLLLVLVLVGWAVLLVTSPVCAMDPFGETVVVPYEPGMCVTVEQENPAHMEVSEAAARVLNQAGNAVSRLTETVRKLIESLERKNSSQTDRGVDGSIRAPSETNAPSTTSSGMSPADSSTLTTTTITTTTTTTTSTTTSPSSSARSNNDTQAVAGTFLDSLKDLWNSICGLAKEVVRGAKSLVDKVVEAWRDSTGSSTSQTSTKDNGSASSPSQASKPSSSKTPASSKPTASKPAAAKPSSGKDDIDLSTVAWDGADIRQWPVTTKLSAGVSKNTVTLNYDKAGVWPNVGKKATDGGPITANAWVIANINGTWRAATWEWLRPGQQSKAARSVAGDHVKKGSWGSGWRPKSGETVYMAVSGLCRDNTRNVAERSQFQKVVWP